MNLLITEELRDKLAAILAHHTISEPMVNRQGYRDLLDALQALTPAPQPVDLSKLTRHTMASWPVGEWVRFSDLAHLTAQATPQVVGSATYTQADVELMWGHGKRGVSLKDALETLPAPPTKGASRE